MTKTGSPAYATHKVEHDRLVATCVDLQKIYARQAEVTPQTTAFVKY
jgi:hemerythrin